MADQFVGEIRMFGCNFAPTGWALCNGQLLPISQNTALFSLLGTYYGGDGKSTFALPNIQGSATMNQGQGQGLTQRYIGESSGESSVTLLVTEMPMHNHLFNAVLNSTLPDPAGNVWGNPTNRRPPPNLFASAVSGAQAMSLNALAQAGNTQPHNNMMPYLVMNYCIAMQGVFPARG